MQPTADIGLVSWSYSSYTTTVLNYMCMSADGSIVIATGTTGYILYSSNYGQDYNRATIDDSTSLYYSSMACSATGQFAITMVESVGSNSGGKKSNDYGQTWTGLDFGSLTKQSTAGANSAVVSSDGSAYLVLGKFFARSLNNNGTSFTQLPTPVDVPSFSTTTTYLFMDRGDRVYFHYYSTVISTGYLHYSDDFGTTWVGMNTPSQPNSMITALSFDASRNHGVALVTLLTSPSYSYLVMISSDGGDSWVNSNVGVAGVLCQDFNSGRYVTVLSSDNSGLSSFDYGANYMLNTAGTTSYKSVVCDATGTYLAAGGINGIAVVGTRQLIPTSQPSRKPTVTPTTRIPTNTPLPSVTPSYRPTCIPSISSVPTVSLVPSTKMPSYKPSYRVENHRLLSQVSHHLSASPHLLQPLHQHQYPESWLGPAPHIKMI